MQFNDLELVARDGIEPSTRGFSIQQTRQFGASKSKTGKGFLLGRPNRLTRPSPCRTGGRESRLVLAAPQRGQRLTGIATELLPNRAPCCAESCAIRASLMRDHLCGMNYRGEAVGRARADTRIITSAAPISPRQTSWLPVRLFQTIALSARRNSIPKRAIA